MYTNELATFQRDLPAQPADLAKFIIVGREKIKALKAEISAIERLEVAKAVHDQKKEELGQIRSLMVLAYQRMGEITKEIPAAPMGRPKKENCSAGGTVFEKPKRQVIQDLGFSKSQVSRMEQMAAHPDVVEEVIAESQAGQTEATQGEVLRRIKERNNRVIDLAEAREERFQEDMAQIDRDFENLKQFRKAILFSGLYELTDEVLDSVARTDADLDMTIEKLEKDIQLLTVIKCKLSERRANRGKKNFFKIG